MTRRAVVLFSLAVFLPSAASGQTPSGQVAASALVVNATITMNTLRNLNFGQVPSGVPTTVVPTGAAAGEWEAIGTGNAFVQISFTLPTTLSNIQAQPGVTMPISFSATSARWRRATNNPAGANVFNPAVGATGRFGPPPNDRMYVWIGGTVSPLATQKPGIYLGTVILTLQY